MQRGATQIKVFLSSRDKPERMNKIRIGTFHVNDRARRRLLAIFLQGAEATRTEVVVTGRAASEAA